MDLNGSGGDGGWSLDDIKRYFTLQRYLPKNGGLFGSGWAQFMANQENAGAGATPSRFMPDTPRTPIVLPPWITAIIPPSGPSKASPFEQLDGVGLAAEPSGQNPVVSTASQGSPAPGQ